MLDAMAECDKVVQYIDLPLQHASDAVLKRMKPARHARELRAAARPDPRARPGRRRCGRRSSSASPARPKRTLTSSATSSRPSVSTTSASSPTRTRKAPRPSLRRRRAGRRSRRQRRDRLMRQQKRIVARQPRSALGERVGWSSTAPRGARAGAAGPAGGPGAGHRPAGLPDRLRPAAYCAAATFIEAEIVGARDYDLLARPLL